MSAVLMKERLPSEIGGADSCIRFRMRPARSRDGLDLERPSAAERELLHVLIVDDYRANADTLSALVKKWGHNVRHAYDGFTGLALAAAFRPDVLLLDMLMANMSGFEVATQVRRQERFKDCFIVAITGRTDEKHRSRCYEAGVDLCLIKPVVPSHLQTLLTLESLHVQSRQSGHRPHLTRNNWSTNE